MLADENVGFLEGFQLAIVMSTTRLWEDFCMFTLVAMTSKFWNTLVLFSEGEILIICNNNHTNPVANRNQHEPENRGLECQLRQKSHNLGEHWKFNSFFCSCKVLNVQN